MADLETNQKITFGLVGYPLGHSFSRDFFTKKFETENINAEYLNFEIPDIKELPTVLAQHPHLKGMNVTIPYKEQVITYLNELDQTAAQIGAVNVIKVIRNPQGEISQLIGYNSDCIGFMDSIRPLLNPTHKKALILGTGGAAKAVYYGLRQLGIEPTYVSRTKAEDRLTYDEIKAHPEIVSEHTVIVNTTPVGMHPHVDESPDLPYDAVTRAHLCYDVVYNPENTAFMQRCAAQGATVKNGHEMLLMQAVAAWKIWCE